MPSENKPNTWRKCLLCGSQSRPSLSLFKFPSEAGKFEIWAQFCKTASPSGVCVIKPSHKLCSRHFSPSSFRKQKGKKWLLKDDAIPTLIVNDTAGSSPSRHVLKNVKGTKSWCCICGGVDTNRRFRFPKNPGDLQKWLDAIGWQKCDLKSNYRLCESHFLPTDIRCSGNRSSLREDAVPSLMLPSPRHSSLASVDTNVSSGESVQCSGSVEVEMAVDEEENYMNLAAEFESRSVERKESAVPSQLIPSPIYSSLASGGIDGSAGECTQCTKRAKIILEVARRDVLEARKRNNLLRCENRRLKKRVQILETVINDLRSRNLLSEDATLLLLS